MNKKKIIIIALCTVLLFSAAVFGYNYLSENYQPKGEDLSGTTSTILTRKVIRTSSGKVTFLDAMKKYKIDILQIGARNMQNFELLKKVGAVNIPVILKRGISATIEESLSFISSSLQVALAILLLAFLRFFE